MAWPFRQICATSRWMQHLDCWCPPPSQSAGRPCVTERHGRGSECTGVHVQDTHFILPPRTSQLVCCIPTAASPSKQALWVARLAVWRYHSRCNQPRPAAPLVDSSGRYRGLPKTRYTAWYLHSVDYDGAGCVPSFCALRQVYRTSPESSRDAGHGYVSYVYWKLENSGGGPGKCCSGLPAFASIMTVPVISTHSSEGLPACEASVI